MEEKKQEPTELRSIIRGVIEEFVQSEQAKAETAYKAELLDERKRREDLERRVNDLVQENQHSRKVAEEAERGASIRAELQRLGVAKVDLAYRIVKDDIQRDQDGRLIAKNGSTDVPVRDYAVRTGKPRAAARAHDGRLGNGIGAQGGSECGRARSGQNSTGHESGRTGQGASGDLAGSQSSDARYVTKRQEGKEEHKCQQLHQRM
jgi:hypothetical protein